MPAKQHTDGQSDASTGSPSSTAPESHAKWEEYHGCPHRWFVFVCNMERQRNANDAVACKAMAESASWKAIAEKLANYIDGIAEDADGCGDEILAKQMRRFVADTISENAALSRPEHQKGPMP